MLAFLPGSLTRPCLQSVMAGKQSAFGSWSPEVLQQILDALLDGVKTAAAACTTFMHLHLPEAAVLTCRWPRQRRHQDAPQHRLLTSWPLFVPLCSACWARRPLIAQLGTASR